MAFERVEIGPCTLYRGRCEDVLPTLPASSIDNVFTSPPYNIGNTSGGGFPNLGHYKTSDGLGKRGGNGKWAAASRLGGLGHGYGTHSDDMPHDEYVAWQNAVLMDCWRLLKDDGAIFYNHKPRVLSGRLVSPFEYLPNLPVRQVVIWARAGGINFSTAFYVPTHEWIVILAKDNWRLKSKGASGVGDVWYVPQEANPRHPAPFPLELPRRAMETTRGHIWLDCFMGSGTTLVAGIHEDRSVIGIESDTVHFHTACDQVARAWELKCSELPFEKPEPLTQRSIFEDVTMPK